MGIKRKITVYLYAAIVKIGCRVEELVDLGIDALVHAHVHRDPLKAGFHQQLHIPLRAGLMICADLHGNSLVFRLHIVRYQLVGVVLRQLVLLHTLHRGAVIRIEVDEDSAGTQNPIPFPIGLFDMRQGPGEIAGHQHVKALRLELRLLRIHLQEANVQAQYSRHMPGVLDHIRRQVNTYGLMPFGGQQTGKKARTGPHIQNTQGLPLGQVSAKLCEPAFPLLTVILPQALGLKALRPESPVGGHAMLDSFHILFLSVWSSFCPPLCTRDSRITGMTNHLHYSTSKNDANAPGGDVFYPCLQTSHSSQICSFSHPLNEKRACEK